MGKTKVLLVVALLSLAFSGVAGADYMIGDKGSEYASTPSDTGRI